VGSWLNSSLEQEAYRAGAPAASVPVSASQATMTESCRFPVADQKIVAAVESAARQSSWQW
jgi:hypothetical protein